MGLRVEKKSNAQAEQKPKGLQIVSVLKQRIAADVRSRAERQRIGCHNDNSGGSHNDN